MRSHYYLVARIKIYRKCGTVLVKVAVEKAFVVVYKVTVSCSLSELCIASSLCAKSDGFLMLRFFIF